MSPLIQRLIHALCVLPGVGQKTAQRMVFYLLRFHRQEGLLLAEALQKAMEGVGSCISCRTFSEVTTCPLCSDVSRDPKILCIVENPLDVVALEQTGSYNGFYFVLHGHLSPLDGIGPSELGFAQLAVRAKNCDEVIVATNPTPEGDATAYYIAEFLKQQSIYAKVTRIAYGISVGSEIEWTDPTTLARSMKAREILVG